MPNTNLEITQKAMEDFKKIQEYMLLAKEENSIKTYAKLKDEYVYLKSFLNIAGVNLTELDKIKEQKEKKYITGCYTMVFGPFV